MHPVHELTKNEIDIATETIFLSFVDDPMMLWLFGGREGYMEHARFAIRTWIRWCMLYGLVIATENCEGVALRKKPGKQKFTLWGMFRSGMFSYYKILGKETMLRFSKLGDILNSVQNKNMGKQKVWYCMTIGVRPDKQGMGYGKSLMQYTFDLAKRDGLPCYLESANPNSIKIHMHNGFELFTPDIIVDSSLKMFAMVRK